MQVISKEKFWGYFGIGYDYTKLIKVLYKSYENQSTEFSQGIMFKGYSDRVEITTPKTEFVIYF